MRLVFMGTPDVAATALERILKEKFNVVGVFCQPPRPAGRGQKEIKSLVQQKAEAENLPLFMPEKFNADAIATLESLKPDLVLVVAYGLLLPRAALAIAPHVNIHYSALPRWRGADPVRYALLAGDQTTEICLMKLEPALDTGPVYLRQKFAIGDDENYSELRNRLSVAGAEMTLELLKKWPNVTAIPQSTEGVTFAPKFGPDMRLLDFAKTATEVHNKIRALSPAPGATARHQDTILKILRAQKAAGNGAPGTVIAAGGEGLVIACGEGAINILDLQRPGKSAMPVKEFLKGYPIKPGDKLV